jgi:uncharacterized protein
MNRRRFVQRGLLFGGTALTMADAEAAERPHESKPRSPVIDVHCHAGKGWDFKRGYPAGDPWNVYNDPKWTLDQAKEVGIDQSVIFPIFNHTYEKANEEIAGYVRKYPRRLIGFAKHDPQSEAGKIRALLTHEIRKLGLKGLKLHGVPSAEMLEAVAKLGIPILMHPPSVGSCLEVVRTHPRIDFILAHLGSFASGNWRDHVAAIEASKSLPNLYLETSSVVFFRYLELAAKELPPEKLLFGSDAPLVDARVELFKIRLLKLGRDKEEKVLGGNAHRLLKL